MCNHENLTFYAMQELSDGTEAPSYNCNDCKSTVFKRCRICGAVLTDQKRNSHYCREHARESQRNSYQKAMGKPCYKNTFQRPITRVPVPPNTAEIIAQARAIEGRVSMRDENVHEEIEENILAND